ncbi:MAG: glucokinase [Candidatus Woesearchaeota archaeon]
MLFKNDVFLVADIGGTKTALALMDSNRNLLIKKIYASSEIKDFTQTLMQFMHLPECRKYRPKDACFAVAGIMNAERNYARLTNTDWAIDVKDIRRNVPLRLVILLNDFEALGLGIDRLRSQDYSELTNLGRQAEGTTSIIGAGTGLGMSILPYCDGRHIPIPSEGGHVHLPILANDVIDIRFQSFLMKKKKYKDAEDVVSGRGIVNIYTFLQTQKVRQDKKVKSVISRTPDEHKPALITKYALEDKDALCIRTLELFVKYYARMARNLALTSMCSELIIAGGIAPKILSALQDVFVEEFVQHEKVNMRKMLECITILVLVDPDVGLYGALNAIKS